MRVLKGNIYHNCNDNVWCVPEQNTGNIDNAKKEERESGGIPEEESGAFQIEIEVEGSAGEGESKAQAQVLCQ